MMTNVIKKFTLVILTAATVFTGCGQKTQNTVSATDPNSGNTAINTASYPMTIKDDAARTITLQKKPEKIIALGMFLNLLYDVGGKSIARCDVNSGDYLHEGTENLPTIGKVNYIDIEKIISMQPDLVILEPVIHDKYISAFAANNIPTIVLKMKNYDEVLEKLKLLGNINETPQKADELIQNIKNKTNDIVSKLPQNPKKVVILYVTSKDVSVKLDKSIAGNVAQILKLKNIASETKPSKTGGEYAPFSMEKIIESDPDVILVTTMVSSKKLAEERIKKDLESNPAWSGLRAVKEGKIVYLPQNLFLSNPGARFYESIEYMAKAVYPEVYGNVGE